jgi:hypothetical protein
MNDTTFDIVDLEGQLAYSDEALRVVALQCAVVGQRKDVWLSTELTLRDADRFYQWLKSE